MFSRTFVLLGSFALILAAAWVVGCQKEEPTKPASQTLERPRILDPKVEFLEAPAPSTTEAPADTGTAPAPADTPAPGTATPAEPPAATPPATGSTPAATPPATTQ
jgi:hypothetical protein